MRVYALLCVCVCETNLTKPFVKTARLESMLASDEWLQLRQIWRLSHSEFGME